MNAVSIPGSEELEVLSPSCIEIVQDISSRTSKEYPGVKDLLPVLKWKGISQIYFRESGIFHTNFCHCGVILRGSFRQFHSPMPRIPSLRASFNRPAAEAAFEVAQFWK
ncbi:hypothetical protein AVEN_6183-1 [Araneus ventricosus]|uniref:Uncharacterized protein n=1 Tax=Araneus ventricosus TaxID=182803 RepID=A0A4Y2TGV5_ARAVE|nr:hypothetical protein AVEN_6183-1 [Araneus ventricosus]